MSAHTPGPWEYRPYPMDDWGVVRCDAGFICQARNPAISFAQEQVHRSAKTDPAEANARLISAAPDMYEALKIARDYMSDAISYAQRAFEGHEETGGIPLMLEELAQVDAALAKASQ